MMRYEKDQTISFSAFTQFPELICRFSTRTLGDLRVRNNAQKAQEFLKLLPLESPKLILMEQVHGASVVLKQIFAPHGLTPQADGMVSNTRGTLLGVVTADCVPLFFYDPQLHSAGVAHAGWRGTLLSIGKNVITQMKELGSQPENIYVAIGPHIGACCYAVDKGRARDFTEKYGSTACVVAQREGKYFLDLGQANRQELIENGIKPEHIDWSLSCTSCQNDRYFSFRKDTKATFGEMLGVIGVINNEF